MDHSRTLAARLFAAGVLLAGAAPAWAATHYVDVNSATNVAGFDYTGHTLQSTANLVSPVVWDTSSPAPVLLNGQNMVTSRITGTRKFYGLLSSF